MKTLKEVMEECQNFESWKECYHTCIFYPCCRRYYRVMEDFGGETREDALISKFAKDIGENHKLELREDNNELA